MKITPWYLAALTPIAVVGCSGELLGHVAVLAVTLGIFFGTLSLGRGPAPASTGSSSGGLATLPPAAAVIVAPVSSVSGATAAPSEDRG